MSKLFYSLGSLFSSTVYLAMHRTDFMSLNVFGRCLLAFCRGKIEDEGT